MSHTMQLVREQQKAGRLAIHEHPVGASSWRLPGVQEVSNLPGMDCTVFDQCLFGLKDPAGYPTQKRTKLLTNSKAIKDTFCIKCNRHTCNHQPEEHTQVWGSMNGVRRSSHAQTYPPAMCKAIAESIQEELRQERTMHLGKDQGLQWWMEPPEDLP